MKYLTTSCICTIVSTEDLHITSVESCDTSCASQRLNRRVLQWFDLPLTSTGWMTILELSLPVWGKRSSPPVWLMESCKKQSYVTLLLFAMHNDWLYRFRGCWSASKQTHHSSSRTYLLSAWSCWAVRPAHVTGENISETPRILHGSSLFVFLDKT